MAERSRIKLPTQKFIGRPINAPNCCGAHDAGRFWIPPLPRPSLAVPIPLLLTHPNLEPTGNACQGSKKGLGPWAFLRRMTHIRNRARTGVSWEGPGSLLAPAWGRGWWEMSGTGWWAAGTQGEMNRKDHIASWLQNASC